MKIETQVAQKRTAESLRYGETLMDALELSEKFRDELEQYAISLEIYENQLKKSKKAEKPDKPQPHMKFLGRNIFEHIQLHLKRIRSSELENTLRFLNQRQCFSLCFYLEHFLRNSVELELASRATLYIMKSYQVQLKLTKEMLPLLKSISLHMKYHFKNLRDDIGINISAIKMIQKEVNEVDKNMDFGLDFNRPEIGGAFEF
jgi:U3 small nucleolar RNA-associated protein 12